MSDVPNFSRDSWRRPKNTLSLLFPFLKASGRPYRPPSNALRPAASARAFALDGDRLAGGGVELQPLHQVEVAAGDAHEAAALGIVDRVDRAHVIDAGMAGLEPVALHLLELGLTRAVAAVDALELAHVGVFDRLAIDRPGRAMIVRRALVRLGVDVGQHDEALVLVDIELARAYRGGRPARVVDGLLVGQELLQQQAHLLAAAGTGVGGRDRK